MDTAYSAEELAFRDEIRAFAQNEIPDDIKAAQADGARLGRDLQIKWQQILAKKGYFAVNWPVEYGGTGWTSTQKYIFQQEMAAANAPSVVPFGVTMAAPVIYTYGNEEQKQRFLPDILNTNVWWCQGYSEPGAGSDLAALQTKAVRDGDHYIVNGQKTWTTLAQHADWIFCLVRTSSEGKRQQGISFLLIDMKTPGIEVQPIITMEGSHEVNSVYFTDVRVPAENLIGEENKGWTYAKVLLQHERTGISGVAHSKRQLARLIEIATKEVRREGRPLIEDPDYSRRVAEVELDLLALEYCDLRVLSDVATGRAPGPESSLLKIKGTEIQQKLTELLVEAAGECALAFQSADSGSNVRVGPSWSWAAAPQYFNMRKASIYGGSNEIQRNVMAKAMLGF